MKIKIIKAVFFKRKSISTLIMRTIILFLSLGLFSFTPVELLSQNVKVVIKNNQEATVDEVFEIIKKQTKYRFVYRSDMFDDLPKIKLEKGAISVNTLLEKSLSKGNFKYEMASNNTIIIKEVSIQKEKNGQTIEIKGKVTDTNGQPVPGITVYVSSYKPTGTEIVKNFIIRGTTTDFDGSFSITAEVGYYLVASGMGFQFYTEEITISKTIYAIILKEEVSALEEVMVVGYGTTKKKDLTGSVGSITSEDIQQIKTQTIDNALIGKIAGVNVSSRGGAPGAGSSVNIRGLTQIRGDNQPLYVIDGTPITITPNSESLGLINYGSRENPLLAINPDDVERIDVLKDASAAAIYGSRAANGVIIVTTKRGKRNQAPRFSFNASSTFQNPVKMYDYLSADDYKKISVNIAQQYLNLYPKMSWPDFPKHYAIVNNPDTYFGKANTNWQDLITNKNALWTQYSFNVNGGTDNVNYMMSAGIQDQQGVMIENDFKRYTFSTNLDVNVTNYFKVGGSVNYNYSINKNKGFSSLDIGSFRPDLPAYNEDGSYFAYNGIFGEQYTALGDGMQDRKKAISKNLLGSIYGEVQIINGLKFKSQLNVSVNSDESNQFYTSKSFENIYYAKKENRPGARLSIQYNESWTTAFENMLSYNKTINEDHRIDAVAGVSWNRTRYDANAYRYRGFPDDDILINIGSANFADGVSSESLEQGLNSIFGRVNYSYKSKYLATFTARRDGSTKFGPDNRYGFFPSVALAWNMHNEDFLKEVSFINQLKLRASLGRTGSDNLPSFTYLAYYKSLANGDSLYDGQNGITVTGVPNSKIKWEETDQLDLGIDLSMFNNCVTAELGYFQKNTSGIILFTPLPYETGSISWNTNVADVSNRGWEFLIGVDIIRDKNFRWNSSFNIATLKNNVEHLYGARLEDTVLIEGKPLGLITGYDVIKIAQTQAEIDALNISAGGTYQNTLTQPGDYIFKDINGDGKITTDDRGPIGDINPDYFGGWNNSIIYKNWDFSMNWNFSQGARRQYDKISRLDDLDTFNNRTREFFDTWTSENTNAPYARYGSPTHGDTQATSRSIVDASYIKLRSASIGYNLPSSLFKDTGITKVRLILSGNNLITISDYPGLDPEDVVKTSFANRSTGFTSDNGASYPNIRTFTFSLNVTF
ncbi:MAG: TonB-dependent receptor [Flavobacterium sp.]|uniref:SusC/RagA family TonB-linked outer membrane protein n=1 Tax=Flavobacterium sp. TaxID=239 RepID=UPI001B1F5ADA|nr:TonB-dependent receptor [Flavobacterium sp.]MBO9585320.1 TonB-dependent receptor [Flavobacterium sp.]